MTASDMISAITHHIVTLQGRARGHRELAANAVAASVVMWPETRRWIADRQDDAARMDAIALWLRLALLDHASGNPDALECAYYQVS